MNVLYIYIPNDCSTIGDVSFLVCNCVWTMPTKLQPWTCTMIILRFTILSRCFSCLIWKIFPPEVYQACGTQIRSCREGYRCGMYLGMPEQCAWQCTKCFSFSFYSYHQNYIPLPKNLKTRAITGDLQPQIYVANSLWCVTWSLPGL